MINRRNLVSAAGLAAASSAISLAGCASLPTKSDFKVPQGPWTQHRQLRRAGGVLNYAVVGEEHSGKPPVVLLHRLGGWLSDWRHVATLLATHRKIIAIDLPGHGGSQWEGPPPYMQTIGETAALLVGAFDELGLDKVDLVGTSLGGCVGVPLAAYWPERVNRFAIVSSALSARRSLEDIHQLIDLGQTDLYDETGMPRVYPEQLLTKTFGIVDTREIYNESIASRAAAGLWIQPSERGVAISDIVGTLGHVNAPTLILYGEKDKAYGKHRDGAMAALPTAVFDTIPDSGAFAIQEKPDITATMLQAFLG
jgi:pimeloyl-ACP methyl ester carboxylesterase